jgi:hypothetical protein
MTGLAGMFSFVVYFTPDSLNPNGNSDSVSPKVLNGSATPEQVVESIESSLFTADRVVFEQGPCRLPDDALPDSTQDPAGC